MESCSIYEYWGAWDSIILIAGYGAPDSNELPKSKRSKRSLPFMPNMTGTLLLLLLSFDHAIPSKPPLRRYLTGQLLLLPRRYQHIRTFPSS